MKEDIFEDYLGFWRIIETSQWVDDHLDMTGTALISISETHGSLRMFALLANLIYKPNKASISFTWNGAWEFDQLSGTGNVKLQSDGRLKGKIKIKNGDESTFVAIRATEPDEPIPDPPSFRDKWRRRW